MKYAGVNVFPSIDSHKYVKIADKVIVIVGSSSSSRDHTGEAGSNTTGRVW